MKLLKVQVSSDILSERGHPRIFEYIDLVEIQNLLQYDKNNIFLYAKLYIKDSLKKNYFLLEKYETISFLHVIKEYDREILCLMGIKTKNPILPNLGKAPWAIIPPIILDPESIHFNFIISESTIKALNNFLSKNAKSYKILAIENLNKEISKYAPLFPHFTKKQNEIARYASRKGFFESPKRISIEEIARHFRISHSTASKHLRLAVQKAMMFFFS
ncbi:MAG: helix-turn-helix domain-containing protein [Promethearchaeota archaeon]